MFSLLFLACCEWLAWEGTGCCKHHLKAQCWSKPPQWWFVLCWVHTEQAGDMLHGPSVESFGKKANKTNSAILSLFSLLHSSMKWWKLTIFENCVPV